MTSSSTRTLKIQLTACAVTVAAGLAVASCAPQNTSPTQTQASNPSVTYKFEGDKELVQANHNAATFCNQYQSVPRTANITDDPDRKTGVKSVVYECVKPPPQPQAYMQPYPYPPAQYNPNLTYTYRTDQELLDVSQNAQNYCMNYGSRQVISNMGTDSSGNRVISFQCAPRG
ncbi:MAG: hypothetical protein HQL45_04315 [Alphaproteobacteria bacterium]|nr:hypothetical protein [Alphaproteobacteria bacterium]